MLRAPRCHYRTRYATPRARAHARTHTCAPCTCGTFAPRCARIHHARLVGLLLPRRTTATACVTCVPRVGRTHATAVPPVVPYHTTFALLPQVHALRIHAFRVFMRYALRRAMPPYLPTLRATLLYACCRAPYLLTTICLLRLPHCLPVLFYPSLFGLHIATQFVHSYTGQFITYIYGYIYNKSAAASGNGNGGRRRTAAAGTAQQSGRMAAAATRR